MLWITHAAIAVGASSLVFQFGTNNLAALSLAIIGSQLPDIDTTTSGIGQMLFPISNWIEDRFPHRSITHSLLATAVLAAIALPIGYHFNHLMTAAVLPFAHVIACFSDTFTKKGVQLFYPIQLQAVFGLNPRRRLKTGGYAEYLVLAIATAVLIFGLWINNNGGIFQQFGQSLSLSSAVIKTYNQNAENHHVYAEIQGFWESDRSSADGKYLILDNQGKEFVITDGKEVYKTGAQIVTSKVKTIVDRRSNKISKSLSFEDEKPTDKLNQIIQKYPEDLIIINGELKVELPGKIELISRPNTMKTLSISGDFLTFDNCLMKNAIAVLENRYVDGTIEITIISPMPKL